MAFTSNTQLEKPAVLGAKVDPNRYTGLAIVFHWVLAILIIGALGFGLYMVDLPFSPSRIRQYNWHKWLGITILLLSAARLLWRLSHPAPALPMGIKRWQRLASHGVHGGLYILFFAIPLAGWAYSSAAGFTVVYFGVLPLPDWVPKDPGLAATLKEVHKWLGRLLASFVILHIGAALKHQFVDGDGLLRRMLPSRK